MQTRGEFLATGAIAALASPKASPSAAPAGSSEAPFAFDLAAFDAMTSKPADHRHMFASTKLSGGTVLDAVKNTLDAYSSLGIAPSGVSTAVVLYHGSALGLAFSDRIWKNLLVPAIPQAPPFVRADLADHEHAAANPFWKPKKPGDASVSGLLEGGTMFFVCNHAMHGFAGLLAAKTQRLSADVYDELVAGLVPGAKLVPAGVWAVSALQERHYTYLQTTL